jgi:uncharacterized protein (DUF1697 family)
MTTWVAMLRGINLGSHKRIAMGELRALFETLGLEGMRTYVVSGNVVFESPRRGRAALAGDIEGAIESTLGHDVTVVLRTGPELARIVAANPFPDAGSSTLYVTFLGDTPARDRVRELEAAPTEGDDEFAVRGTEVYLHFPNGYGRSKLNNEALERQLGVAGTTRNWRTTTTLAGMASERR